MVQEKSLESKIVPVIIFLLAIFPVLQNQNLRERGIFNSIIIPFFTLAYQ